MLEDVLLQPQHHMQVVEGFKLQRRVVPAAAGRATNDGVVPLLDEAVVALVKGLPRANAIMLAPQQRSRWLLMKSLPWSSVGFGLTVFRFDKRLAGAPTRRNEAHEPASDRERLAPDLKWDQGPVTGRLSPRCQAFPSRETEGKTEGGSMRCGSSLRSERSGCRSRNRSAP